MKEKKQRAVPQELLTKEFLRQFRTEDDVSRFQSDLHAQVLEQMLEGEMDSHLGYEKHSTAGNNTGNSRNGSFHKKIQTQHGESVIQVLRDRQGELTGKKLPVFLLAARPNSSKLVWLSLRSVGSIPLSYPSTRAADYPSRDWLSRSTPRE